MNIVEKSLELATAAHKGQMRRDGKTEYITHPIEVSKIAEKWFSLALGNNWMELPHYGLHSLIYDTYKQYVQTISKEEFLDIIKVLSVAHDISEDAYDKGFTIDYIINELKQENPHLNKVIFEIIGLSLDDLTHRKDESYLKYILGIKQNQISTIIKLADIEHNLSTLEDGNKTMRDKYELTRHILLSK